jgi:hypothetical protein
MNLLDWISQRTSDRHYDRNYRPKMVKFWDRQMERLAAQVQIIFLTSRKRSTELKHIDVRV